MAVATDTQVQTFSDQRVRPRTEQLRNLIASLRDDKASIDAVYAACSAQSPTWADQRTDGPAKLLAPSDILLYNSVITSLLAVIDGTASAGDITNIHNSWAAFVAASVHPE